MKVAPPKLLPVVVASSLLAAMQKEPESSERLKEVDAYVYYCHDGDTCRVKIADSMWVNVRLAGIDAPEVSGRKSGKSAQPLAEEAKSFLNRTVQKKTVKLRQTDLDHFNRPVVELIESGKTVNLLMIENGYAEAYRGKTKRLDKAPYQAAEAAAKAAKKGIWGLSQYQSPQEYRRKNGR